MEPIKTIKYSESYTNKQLILSGIMIIVGIVGLFINAGHLLGLGILLFVVNYFQKNRDAIKVYNDHLVVKLGPIAPTKFIKLSQFSEVVNDGQKKMTLFYNEGEKDKKLRFHNSVFNKEDMDYLNHLISDQIKKAA